MPTVPLHCRRSGFSQRSTPFLYIGIVVINTMIIIYGVYGDDFRAASRTTAATLRVSTIIDIVIAVARLSRRWVRTRLGFTIGRIGSLKNDNGYGNRRLTSSPAVASGSTPKVNFLDRSYQSVFYFFFYLFPVRFNRRTICTRRTVVTTIIIIIFLSRRSRVLLFFFFFYRRAEESFAGRFITVSYVARVSLLIDCIASERANIYVVVAAPC